MKRKGKLSRQRRARANEEYVDEKVPRSFVIHHGVISSNIRNLITDFKRVMMPNTAQRLVAKKRNTLKDFVAMSGLMKVSHIVIFSQTDLGIIMKIGRFPQGPTLSFRVDEFSLLKDVVNSQLKQAVDSHLSLHAPCLMTNLQPSEGENHLQLCSKMFLDMFPTISPTNVNLKFVKRCCLIHYDEESKAFDFRHYAIKMRPVAVSKATRKLLSSKVPDLSSYKEVADFVLKSESIPMSEAEDDPSTHISLGKLTKGDHKRKSIIKLIEVGPRLSMKLIKIEEGLCQGPVLYHKFRTLSAEDKLEILKKREQKRKLKRQRRTEQEKNVEKKKLMKEQHRKKCLKGMGIDTANTKAQQESESDDDDVQYYKNEVGEEPDKELFPSKRMKKNVKPSRTKKRKIDK